MSTRAFTVETNRQAVNAIEACAAAVVYVYEAKGGRSVTTRSDDRAAPPSRQRRAAGRTQSAGSVTGRIVGN